jgi:hypothetical protein
LRNQAKYQSAGSEHIATANGKRRQIRSLVKVRGLESFLQQVRMPASVLAQIHYAVVIFVVQCAGLALPAAVTFAGSYIDAKLGDVSRLALYTGWAAMTTKQNIDDRRLPTLNTRYELSREDE